ncbi:UNVERIFIED_CONTAM: 3-hydroxy-3-methylglutaryl-coenzyme A reductase 1 [Sesamum radiatum]|uniref:3-hydroxy-3-methylglutaryl-coenzyme A reductase 1 n=1 Tax=Sesamum radiatum TaxID=300843 RepID=A0AAW2SIK9_SESRA
MEIRRRPLNHPLPPCTVSGDAVCRKASDALPLPLYLTNAIFFTLFFSVAYFLLHRWRDKIRNSVPLHVLTLSELAAVVSLIASFIYLLGFFGIDFVQSFISKSESDDENQHCVVHEAGKGRCSIPTPVVSKLTTMDGSQDDEGLIKRVVSGEIPSYSLESKLGDCFKSAKIRREAVQRMTGRSMDGLPLEGFDYDSILGQCCEMPVGYVQIPVGIAGPLLLNGREYSVPMATTEGCLVASTNRGCKAIYTSGGATSVLSPGWDDQSSGGEVSVSEEGGRVEIFFGGSP